MSVSSGSERFHVVLIRIVWLLTACLLCVGTFVLERAAHQDHPRIAHLKLDVAAGAMAVVAQAITPRGDKTMRQIQLPAATEETRWEIAIENPPDQGSWAYISGILVAGKPDDLKSRLAGTDGERLLKPADWAPNGYVLELKPGDRIGPIAIEKSSRLGIQYLKKNAGHFVLRANGQRIEIPTFANESDFAEFQLDAPRRDPLVGYDMPVSFDFGRNARLSLVSVPAGAVALSGVRAEDAISRIQGGDVTFSSLQVLSLSAWWSSLLFWSVLTGIGFIVVSRRSSMTLTQSVLCEAALLSAGVTYVYTMLFYPGFAQSDTVSAFQDALYLATTGTSPGMLWTYLNTLVSFVSIRLEGSQYLNVAGISVATVAATYGILCLLAGRTAALLGTAVLGAIPLYWNNTFSYTSDSLTAAGYLVLCMALLMSRSTSAWRDLRWLVPLAAIGAFFFSGARQNGAIAAIAFLGLCLLFRRRLKVGAAVLASAWVGLVCAVAVNGAPGAQHKGLAGMVMAWELVGISRFVHDDRIEAVLNQMGNAGEARAIFDPSLFDNIVFGKGDGAAPINASRIGTAGLTEAYVWTAIHHPAAFLRNKLDIWKAIWGLDVIHIKTLGTWVLSRATAHGASIDLNLMPSLPRQSASMISMLREFAESPYTSVFFSPFFFLLCSLGLIIVRGGRTDDSLLFGGALIYQCTFMIAVPGIHFRYGWLFVVASMLIVAAAIAHGVRSAFPLSLGHVQRA